jgi:hypothetical protein
MKTTIVISAICSIILISNPDFAQLNPNDVSNSVTLKSDSKTPVERPVGSMDNSGSGMPGLKSDLGKEGNLFFNDWSPGTVILADNTVITDRMLRYDIYHRQMQFAFNGDTAAFGKPEEIKSISFENNNFVFEEFMCPDGKRKDYLEVLVDGSCRLLLYRCIIYKYIVENAIPDDENSKDEYYQTKKYFISKDNKVPVQLPEKKNEVIELLSDTGKDIKTFMQENKIKLFDEQDLVRLVNYYNEH